jgi:hypothetical protein
LLARKAAMPAELVSEYVAGLDVARHGPGRVHVPVPLPGGVAGVWNCGLHALREAVVRTIRFVDPKTGEPDPARDASTSRGAGFQARSLDPDRLRGCGVQRRWLRS